MADGEVTEGAKKRSSFFAARYLRSSSPFRAELGAGVRAARGSAPRALVVAPLVLGLALRETLGVPDTGGVVADEALAAQTVGSARCVSGALACGSARTLPRDSSTP